MIASTYCQATLCNNASFLDARKVNYANIHLDEDNKKEKHSFEIFCNPGLDCALIKNNPLFKKPIDIQNEPVNTQTR